MKYKVKYIMLNTVIPLIEARSLMQARGLTAFVPIQAGSLIEANV